MPRKRKPLSETQRLATNARRRLARAKTYTTVKDTLNAYRRAWRVNRRDVALTTDRAYREANRDKIRAYQALYRLTHPRKRSDARKPQPLLSWSQGDAMPPFFTEEHGPVLPDVVEAVQLNNLTQGFTYAPERPSAS